MKQNLQRISEWIELFLNYAVVFGIEIALNALIGDRVPVGVWLLQPCTLSAFICSVKS